MLFTRGKSPRRFWSILFFVAVILSTIFIWKSGDKVPVNEVPAQITAGSSVKESAQRFKQDEVKEHPADPPKAISSTTTAKNKRPESRQQSKREDNYDIHIVFSTDCSPYQDWQTIVLFHSAKTVGQKGRVTRIASGCTTAQQKTRDELYAKLYPSGLYTAHYTPSFKKDLVTGKEYHFYNKPWGMKHFLQHANPPVPSDMVLALLDPDMIFLRPITTQVKGMSNNIFNRRGKFKVTDSDIIEKIGKGHPVGQTYGLGAPWTNDDHKQFNRTYICGTGSPCLNVSMGFAAQHYAVGPPYIAHREDFIRIADSWTNTVPKVYEGYPLLLAEMYAYSMGAAHENLPHLQAENFMVSNTKAGGEGWPWVDVLEVDACEEPSNSGIFFPNRPMPNVVHYCQVFRSGEFRFAKRRVTSRDVFSCDSPMLMELPVDLGKKGYEILHSRKELTNKERNQGLQAKRNAFTLCVVFRAINSAILDYKQKLCPTEAFNTDKTLNFDKMIVH